MRKRSGVFALLLCAIGLVHAQTPDANQRFDASDLLKPVRGVCDLIQSTTTRSAEQSAARASLLSGACVDAKESSNAVLAQGVAQGHIGAMLRALASGSRSVSVKISDADLLRALEEAAHSSDPYTLYVLSGYANSSHAEALQFRTGTSLLLGESATTAWLFAACESGLDCTKRGLLVSTNCALSGFCMEPSLDNPIGFDASAVRVVLEDIKARRRSGAKFFDNMRALN